MSARKAASERLTVCLVADDEVINRFPESVRYLQVGLIDEPIDFVLVCPEHPRAGKLLSGPTKLLQHRRYHRLIERFALRGIVREVTAFLNKPRYDGPLIVHSLSVTAAPLAAQVARAMEADLLVNVTARRALEDPALFHALEQATEIVTPVRAFADAFQHTPGLSEKPIDVLPFAAGAEDEPTAFSKAGRVATLMAAGPLEPEFGFDTLLHAIKRVHGQFNNIAVFLVGKGSAEDDLRHLASSLGLTDKITFTGRLDNTRAAIKAADMFCVPRAPASFREEPILALAAGVLLLADEMILIDGLQHRHNARLFPGGDDAALAEQLRWALGNREESRRVASAGLALAKARHTLTEMVDHYLRIYGQIAATRKTLKLDAKA